MIRAAEGYDAIQAVVYLADGVQCRCVQVPAAGTVEDVIEHMLQVQEEWEEIGQDGPKPLSFREAADSSTDDLIDHYAIVEVHTPAEGVPREKILARKLQLSAPELKAVRAEWQRTLMRHLAARFKFAQHGGAGTKGAKKKGGKKKGESEFWFVNPNPTMARAEDDVKIKFVNLDHYQVVRTKRGWLDVKDKGKVRSRWVEFQEDQLLVFKDADAESPQTVLAEVNQCEMKLKKGSKDKVSIKLKRGGTKLALICENDIMADKWFQALRQGKSGAIAEANDAAANTGGGIKLKLGFVPDDIPEYTEAEEEADLAHAVSGQLILGMGAQGATGIRQDAFDGGYMSVAKQQDDYLTVSQMQDLLVNSEGSYLTIGDMQRLAQDAGYMGVDEMRQLVNPSGDYLTVEAMQALCHDAGYLTVAEMQDLAGLGA